MLVGRRVDRARILLYQVFARNRFAQNQPPVLIPMSARVFVQNLLPVRITMFGMSVQVLQNQLPVRITMFRMSVRVLQVRITMSAKTARVL